jgi:hypothetical protein
MSESTSAIVPDGHRERLLHGATFVLAVLLLPVAALRAPGRARYLACQWALGLRFPRENLDGLTPGTRAAFTAARTVAFWRDGQLIGVTSGHRDAGQQFRLYAAEIRRTGSVPAARRRVLPPEESSHVQGTALDIRPYAGARWLERHGADHDLHRIYDNEWWHFEYIPDSGRAAAATPSPPQRGTATSFGLPCRKLPNRQNVSGSCRSGPVSQSAYLRVSLVIGTIGSPE